MGCRKFFEENAGNNDKCKELQDKDAALLAEWETEVASEFSPGVVGDEEMLYQQIVDPTHVKPNSRELKPTAFQDSANKGMSVNRIIHTDKDALLQRGRARAAKFNEDNPERPNRSLIGLAKFQAGRVRAILDSASNKRAFYVYDTSKPDDESHADICQGVKDSKKTAKSDNRSVRYFLYEMALEEGAVDWCD
jgi:hypothetical protein